MAKVLNWKHELETSCLFCLVLVDDSLGLVLEVVMLLGQHETQQAIACCLGGDHHSHWLMDAHTFNIPDDLNNATCVYVNSNVFVHPMCYCPKVSNRETNYLSMVSPLVLHSEGRSTISSNSNDDGDDDDDDDDDMMFLSSECNTRGPTMENDVAPLFLTLGERTHGVNKHIWIDTPRWLCPSHLEC